MNKEGLLRVVASRTGIPASIVRKCTDVLLLTISENMVNGVKTHIPGFGAFEAKERAPRMGRNPRTNTPVPISARRVPYFTPSKTLKTSIDNSKTTVKEKSNDYRKNDHA